LVKLIFLDELFTKKVNMKISVDTEIEEIEELRHAVAILEEAIKRREDPDAEQHIPDESPSEPETQNEESTQDSFETPQETPTEPETLTPQPDVDMSSLSMSNYGEEKENRTVDNLSSEPSSPPETPNQDNKTQIKEIILSIRNQNPGQPIQMQDIITKASEKNIPEDTTRNLVSELQKDGSI
jgi:hypothetical protein